MNKIPLTVYSLTANNPLKSIGGVELVHRNLRDIFENVIFLDFHTPHDLIEDLKRNNEIIIADGWLGQQVNDYENMIVMAHGSAHKAEHQLQKFRCGASMKFFLPGEQAIYGTYTKPKVVASCESVKQWTKEYFPHTKLNIEVIHHHVQPEFFENAKGDPKEIKVIGCDPRGRNKGDYLIKRLQEKFPEAEFRRMECTYEKRLEKYLEFDAFIHLSMTEGNSLVCLESMALNLPLMTTDTGLFATVKPKNVRIVSTDATFMNFEYVVAMFELWMKELTEDFPQKNDWIKDNCQLETVKGQWERLLVGMGKL